MGRNMTISRSPVDPIACSRSGIVLNASPLTLDVHRHEIKRINLKEVTLVQDCMMLTDENFPPILGYMKCL
jgi:hypothetical protein